MTSERLLRRDPHCSTFCKARTTLVRSWASGIGQNSNALHKSGNHASLCRFVSFVADALQCICMPHTRKYTSAPEHPRNTFHYKHLSPPRTTDFEQFSAWTSVTFLRLLSAPIIEVVGRCCLLNMATPTLNPKTSNTVQAL